MAQVPAVFTVVTPLTTVGVVMYTQPVNSLGQIVRAAVHNIDVVPRQLTVYRVPNGGIIANSNRVIGGAGGRVMPGQDLVLNVLAGMVLAPGDAIVALADFDNMINFFMSGYNNT